MVPPINFYKTRIKDPVILTRIRSSSNLLIFLIRVDSTHGLHTSGAFFACCRTCEVKIKPRLSVLHEQRNTSFTVEICLLPLSFFLTVDELLENPTVINLSRSVDCQKQSGKYLTCAYDRQFYPRKFGKVRRNVGSEYS